MPRLPRDRPPTPRISLLLGLLLPLFGLLTTARSAPTRQGPAGESATWRLGVLFWHDSPNDAVALRGIRKALAVRGHPFELRVRRCDSDKAAGARHIESFRSEGIDLLFAMGTEAALVAKGHASDLSVVFTAVTNPVESGVVASWKGSGRHLAGNSNWIFPETLLDVFHLAVPDLRRLGILRSSVSGVVSEAELRGMQAYLTRRSERATKLVEEVADDVPGIARAVRKLAESGVDAIWIPIDFMIYENMDRVRKAAREAGVPLVSSSLKGTEAGAVAGVHADYELLGERAVVIALELLEHGADPGRLPIGTMQSYRVVVNLSAARDCGYELPLSLLALADTILVGSRVVEPSPRKGE